VRQARRTSHPEPAVAAGICELAGAQQVIVHLREDRRHIQERDLRILRQTVRTSLNLEMAATQEMIKIAYDVKPDQVTLLPERRDEATTESGLDVGHHREQLKKTVQSINDADIAVSLLIDPDLDQVRAAHRVDPSTVELHTGKFCQARGQRERRAELQRIVDAARAADKLGMRVVAGHGLDQHTILDLMSVEEIQQFNLGHGLLAQAVFVGLERAVGDMVALLRA